MGAVVSRASRFSFISGREPDRDGPPRCGPAFVELAVLIFVFLAASHPAFAAPGDVVSEVKLSDLAGNLSGLLDVDDEFGVGAAAIGDLDRDGVDDIAVGAWRDDDGGTDSGAVWILFLNPGGTLKASQKISRTEGGFSGPLTDFANFGGSIAALGDLDGDGVMDLAVSAHNDDTRATNLGAFFVLFLNTNGTVKASQRVDRVAGGVGVTGEGLGAQDAFGFGLSAIGDLDGDGYTELAVGAFGDDDGGANFGAVWILYMLPNGTVHHAQKISALEGGFTGALDPGDRFGISTARLGDLDGDGVPDIAVGADQDDFGGTNAGAVWILRLNRSGGVKAHSRINGSELGFLFGFALAAPGDLNGDGLPEIAVTELLNNEGGPDRGAVWMYSLDSMGNATFLRRIAEFSGGLSASLSDGDRFGSALAALDSFDGGGGGLLVGAYRDDDGGVNHGAAYLLQLEGSAPLCGDGFRDPLEECDDTNLADFDGCSAACEFEDDFSVFGVAANSGVLSATIDGMGVDVSVSSGDTPDVMASVMSAAINATPALMALGTTAQAVGNTVTTNGTFNGGSTSSDDVSLSVNPGTVLSHQKISETEGEFFGALSFEDFFGNAVESIGDLDGDGIGDIAVGAYNTSDGGALRGGLWILFRNADGTVKAEQKISDQVGGLNNLLADFDRFGTSVTSLGDLDGDGIVDLAVGAVPFDQGAPSVLPNGAVWILFLNSDGTVKDFQKISETDGGFGGALGTGSGFAFSLEAVGDVDRDGVQDLAVGAFPGFNGITSPPFESGSVWILFLNPNGTVRDETQIGANLSGAYGFGFSLAALDDFDGDGVPDLAVGAVEASAVWILFLNTDGTIKSTETIGAGFDGFTGILGTRVDVFGVVLSLSRLGSSVSNVGDLDGDGVIDLLVGEPFDDDLGGSLSGSNWLLSLNPDGSVKGFQKISGTQGGFTGILEGGDLFSSGGDYFGTSNGFLGDLNGDGRPEVMTGAPGDDDGGGNQGAVWILTLDGVAKAFCGDGVIVAPETCEDGNMVSGDGCYSTCQIEDEFELSGVATGGAVVMNIDGVDVTLLTSPGESAATVVTNLSAALALNATLSRENISATAIDGRFVTNGGIDSIVASDPGLIVPEPGFLSMLAIGALGMVASARRRL